VTRVAGSIAMKALQRADKALGLAACAALQPLRWWPRRAKPAERAERVLAIKFWGIGSLQLLTPAIASLRARHPHAELVFLTLATNRDVAERLRLFDRVITLDVADASWPAVLARIASLLRDLRRERFDEVYDFEFFTRFSAVVSMLSGAPRRHGFASPRVWRGALHTDVAPFNRYWHVARNFRVLAGGENGRNVAASDLEPVHFGERDEVAAAHALGQHGLAADEPFVVLNVNAGSLSLERRWPRAMFAALAARLIDEDRVAVVLIGSSAERAYTQHVAEMVDSPRCVNLAGELSTGALAATLARAVVVVTNDSGPMHLAAALGAPTLGLFGPETPVMYGPLGNRVKALYRPPPCSPCINVHDNKLSSCIYGEPQCLVGISVDEVLQATRALARGDDFELVPLPRHADASLAARRN
jgi:lipopolysaccharide heptosyltransferase II